jgi:hypothetical protein
MEFTLKIKSKALTIHGKQRINVIKVFLTGGLITVKISHSR